MVNKQRSIEAERNHTLLWFLFIFSKEEEEMCGAADARTDLCEVKFYINTLGSQAAPGLSNGVLNTSCRSRFFKFKLGFVTQTVSEWFGLPFPVAGCGVFCSQDKCYATIPHCMNSGFSFYTGSPSLSQALESVPTELLKNAHDRCAHCFPPSVYVHLNGGDFSFCSSSLLYMKKWKK